MILTIPLYDVRLSAMVHFWTSLRAEWKSELRCMYLNGQVNVYFRKIGRFEVEIEDSKNMEGLRIMPRYGIKNKKK